MATIEQRLKVLEAASPKQYGNLEKQRTEAFGNASLQCWKVLKDRLPDEPKYIGHTQQIDYSKKYVTHDDKLNAAVERIKSGIITKDDQQVLDALPLDALAVMKMTAGEWVVWHTDLLESI